MKNTEIIEALTKLGAKGINCFTVVSKPDYNGGRQCRIADGAVEREDLAPFEDLCWVGDLTEAFRERNFILFNEYNTRHGLEREEFTLGEFVKDYPYLILTYWKK